MNAVQIVLRFRDFARHGVSYDQCGFAPGTRRVAVDFVALDDMNAGIRGDLDTGRAFFRIAMFFAIVPPNHFADTALLVEQNLRRGIVGRALQNAVQPGELAYR